MAKTNFYLKNAKAKGKTLIFLMCSYDGKRLKYSTGISIEPKYWNNADQRARKSFPGATSFNSCLSNIAANAIEIYNSAKANNKSLNTSEFKDLLFARLNENTIKESELTIFDYLAEFIEVSKASKRIKTIKKYKTLVNHLQAYCEQNKNFKLSFDTINAKFYESFVAFYIREMRVLNNTVGKNISTLKTFLHWATERGYNSNTAFTKFKATKTDADIVYLTFEELMILYNFDLTKNKRLSQVRDSFCFGCFSGLRFSDIQRINKESVKGDELHISVYKTKESLTVPLNEFSSAILERNNFALPVISNQKTNQYVKELCELAGINEPITLTKYRGAEEVKYSEPKFKFISSHTARRTFVTLSLEKGMRPELVMSITGHKEYKTFKKYIKLTDKVKKEEMQRFWNSSSQTKIVKMA